MFLLEKLRYATTSLVVVYFSDSFSFSPRLNATLVDLAWSRESARIASIDRGLRGARNSKDLVVENATRARERELRQIVGIISTRAGLIF